MKMRMVLLSVVLVFLLGWPVGIFGHDYGQALSKSILFYEAQRSGPLPRNQRVSWRSHSGLNDGKASGVDLVGGYYDAGDNVKFGLPMAFTTTMMSWSVIEYGRQMRSQGELNHALSAIKWGTDYFIKAHPQPNVLYGEVGDGKTDHYCWQRPEDMTTDRSAYRIDPSRPGSDLAGETAAAMAASSIVFRRRNRKYSAILLTHARQLFSFADRYRGKYDSSITVAQKYYRSVSGYNDELLWAAAWLYKATKEQYYLNYLAINADIMGGTGWAMTEFSWDVKYAGVQILISKFLMSGKAGHHASTFRRYQDKAEFFICSMLGKSNKNVRKTPSGLIYKQSWNNMQFVTSASFLLTIYSDYLNSARAKTMTCPTTNIRVYSNELLSMAKSQVDYILGDNPRATSYMVGYGSNYPRQVHHRGASIVSIKEDSKFVSCRGGYATWFSRKMSDPNVLMGAIVGGPDAYDNYADQRDNYEQSEPATYNNAPLMGVLARLGGGHTGYNQLVTGDDDSDAAVVRSPPPPPKTSPPPRRVRAPVRKPASPVTITQRSTTSWRSKGRTYHRYSVIINNKSFKTLKNPQIRINRLYGPIWGLHKHNKFYSLPSGSLPARQSFQFVYIHAASPALISVSGYTLV